MPSVSVPNTFTPSTTISSSQVNANFTAMANGIIASLGLAGADTMTGQLRAANGTAAAPALTFGSDLDVGVYRRGANELGFSTAGVLAGYFDSGGKLWLEDELDLAGAADIGGNLIVQGVINLGHATDTTISRVSAGVIAVEGSNVLLASGLGSITQAFDADTLKADVADTLSAGFDSSGFNAGTKSSGTYTPDPASGNFQHAVNGGAHTLAPPGSTCSIVVQYTNNASAGAVTVSGFTKVSGAFTTTNGDDFMCFITRNNAFSHLNIVPLQ